MAAMLVYITRETNEKSFVNEHEHGSNDDTDKQIKNDKKELMKNDSLL
jgi:hypothetical protein